MRRFIMFTGVLSLILDFYVFQAIKTITARWRSEQFRKITHWAYWLFQIGFTLCFVYVVYLRFTLDHNTAFMKLIMNGFLVLFVTKLIVVAVLFAEDIYRGLVLVYRMMHRPAGYENERAIRPGRRKFISQLALGLAAIPFASLVYGMVKGKHQYTVHRHTLFFDDLPEAFDGFKITQLSDFHAGSFEDVAAVQEGIDLAKAQNPDLVVFTGDLVNDLASELE
ncbi:MAG TPA: metallophosphoesterase, partial [Adhaeribacter sp.]|nr:metallophosphoesterase [Adhaeribacter sp.]